MEDGTDQRPVLFGFTKRQLRFLSILGLTNIFRGFWILIVGPIFPPEAEIRNVTDAEIGFIFAVFDFTAFIGSLVYGKRLIKRFGPRKIFIASTVNSGLCMILFGCLGFIDDKTPFLVCSFLVRILAGAGDALFYPSCFTVFTLEMPDHVSTSIGIFELFFGVGAIAGPVIAGALVDGLGFTVVYAIVGTIVLITAALVFFLTPIPVESTKEDKCIPGLSLMQLLRIPDVIMVIVSLVMTASSIGFITATLERHLEQFELSSAAVGAVFSGGNLIYMLGSPGWGFLTDKFPKSKKLIMISGAGLIIVGFSFLGPLPFIDTETKLWTIWAGMALHGIGIGGSIMSAYPQALDSALVNGFPDSHVTYGLVSSIFTSTFSLGNCIGPAVGGVLAGEENIGFRWGTLFVIGFAGLVIFLAFSLGIWQKSVLAKNNHNHAREDTFDNSCQKEQR